MKAKPIQSVVQRNDGCGLAGTVWRWRAEREEKSPLIKRKRCLLNTETPIQNAHIGRM